jgi:Yip1-like protein
MRAFRQGGDVMAIVQRIKSICLKPKDEWQVIAAESTSTADLFKNYALPLAAIGAVAGFIGMSFIGISVPFIGTIRTPLVSGLISAVVGLALALVGVYVLALIIDALAPKFGGEKNMSQALKVAVYSSTPAWVAGALRILPSLGILVLVASCYGLYILYLGLPRLMKSPQEKAVTYTVVVVLCAIGIALVTGLVVGGITGAAGGGMGAMPSVR